MWKVAFWKAFLLFRWTQLAESATYRCLEARQLMLNEDLDASKPVGGWATKVPHSSAGNTPACLARRHSATYEECALIT